MPPPVMGMQHMIVHCKTAGRRVGISYRVSEKGGITIDFACLDQNMCDGFVWPDGCETIRGVRAEMAGN